MEGLGGFEPPTYGLGNPYTTVHPVRIHDFSVGYSGSHSDPRLLFGHDNAPHDAPRAQAAHEKSNGSLSVADCLQRAAPVLKVSKRRLKQLEIIQLIR